MEHHPENNRQSIFNHVPGWDAGRLAQAKALVVGAGALGNEVLKNLGLLGIGEVTILDFDKVEASNLSRSVLFRESDVGCFKAEVAAERLKEINPGVTAHAVVGDILCDLGWGDIAKMDLIFGCLDNRLARLWLNRWAFRAGKAWVGGGILNLSGQVTVYRDGEACFECGLTKQGWEDIKQRMGCADMAERYYNAGIQPTTPIAASIMGGVMVQEGLKLLFEQEEHRLKGQMWSYEGQMLHSEVYDLTATSPDCQSHFRWPDPMQIEGISRMASLGKTLSILNNSFGGVAAIELDHPVAMEIATVQSKQIYPFVKPLLHLSNEMAERYRKVEGEAIGVPRGKLLTRLDDSFPKKESSLADLGVPARHVLRVNCAGNKYYVILPD